jgi:hypothetical protein
VKNGVKKSAILSEWLLVERSLMRDHSLAGICSAAVGRLVPLSDQFSDP